MSIDRRWAVLLGVGSLASGCELDLEGRACGVSSSGEEQTCMEGWTCCPSNLCERECSEPTEPSPPAEPPPLTTSTSVGPEGGVLVSGEARVEIPAGALTQATDLAFGPLALPLTLPLARELTGEVYSFAPGTSFGAPVSMELPVGASAFQHLILLELVGDEWLPVAGASYAAEPVSDEATGGTVSWSSDHGGVFAVVIANHRTSLDMLLGDAPYAWACYSGASSVSAVGPNGGIGPTIDTANSVNAPEECPWPAENPRLYVSVLLRNYLPSDGPPTGTWDLADPSTILPLRIEFIGSIEHGLLVGQEAPYQTYDSTVALADGETASVSYDGFGQSTLASGSVHVSRLTTVANTGRSDFLGDPPTPGLYEIQLENVILSAAGAAEPTPTEPFPPAVTLSRATLTHAF